MDKEEAASAAAHSEEPTPAAGDADYEIVLIDGESVFIDCTLDMSGPDGEPA